MRQHADVTITPVINLVPIISLISLVRWLGFPGGFDCMILPKTRQNSTRRLCSCLQKDDGPTETKRDKALFARCDSSSVTRLCRDGQFKTHAAEKMLVAPGTEA